MFRHRSAIFRESTNAKVYKFDIPLQVKMIIFTVILPEIVTLPEVECRTFDPLCSHTPCRLHSGAETCRSCYLL